jgi:hypothetical protein
LAGVLPNVAHAFDFAAPGNAHTVLFRCCPNVFAILSVHCVQTKRSWLILLFSI